MAKDFDYIGKADLGYLGDANLSQGFNDALPDGARRGRSNKNGDDYLAYELGEEARSDPFAVEMENLEREQMQGGFIERPGLVDWRKHDVERT